MQSRKPCKEENGVLNRDLSIPEFFEPGVTFEFRILPMHFAKFRTS